MNFNISRIVKQIGTTIYISGISSSTTNDRGDNTITYTNYVVSGVVEVIDGSEDIVKEGVLTKNDITVYVDEDETSSPYLVTENLLRPVMLTSGVFRIVGSIHNQGHYEVYGKRILKV